MNNAIIIFFLSSEFLKTVLVTLVDIVFVTFGYTLSVAFIIFILHNYWSINNTFWILTILTSTSDTIPTIIHFAGLILFTLILTFIVISFWMLDFSWTVSYEKFGSLVFSDIVNDDSWPWYLGTDKVRFFGGKKWWPKFRSNGPKPVSKLVFFAIFSSLVH